MQPEITHSSFVHSNRDLRIQNSSLTTTRSARNLGFIFDEHLTFSDQISAVSKNLDITIFDIFAVSVYTSIPKQLPPSPLPLFTPSSTTATLLFTLSQPAQVSDHPAPTDPELSCTCCCQSSQIQSHHSHPSVYALVKNNHAH